jgi:hypothetical protein
MKALLLIPFLFSSLAHGQMLQAIVGQQAAVTGSTVATPSFSPGGGSYSSTQTVTISTATSLAVLCYTTDGSTPTESGHLCSGGTTSTYSTPISVATTQTVKAIGTKATYTDSAVGSATYTITVPVTFTHVAGASGGCSEANSDCTYSNTYRLDLTLGSAPATGDNETCMFWISTIGSPTVTLVDANSNSYTQASGSPIYLSAAGSYQFIFRLLNAPSNASAEIIAATSYPSGGYMWFACDGFHRSSGTWATDSDVTGTNSGSTATLPSITVTGATDVLYATASAVNIPTGATSPWVCNAYTLSKGICFAEYQLNAATSTNVNFTGATGTTVVEGVSTR